MGTRLWFSAAALCVCASATYSQSNARENAVLIKLKEMYRSLDAAIVKADIDKALTFYAKECLIQPQTGKPIEVVDALIARTDMFALAKNMTVKTSTKTIRVNGNSATVNAVVTVEATLPQRGFSNRTVQVKVRTVAEDKWTYKKGWRISGVRVLQDQMWFDGKLQGPAAGKKG